MSSIEKTFDIAVVGAGPAGSTAAYLLAAQGYQVVLVDKQRFPRPKLCAGLLTWKSIDLLKSIFGFSVDDMIRRGLISHRTHDYRIYHGSDMLARGRLNYPFHFVDRTTYDHFWLEKAVEAGARAITGQAVHEVDASTGTIRLTGGLKVRAHVIIGADGVWSLARRSIFSTATAKKRWRSQLAMTVETHCAQADMKPPRDYASLHFGLVPWGYAWSFPGGRHQIVGVCSLHNKDNRHLTAGFKVFLASIGIDPKITAPNKGHALPFGNFLDPPGRGRVLLVGDACGLADPLLGEGIYYAHRSAQIAARCIMACAPAYANLDRLYRSRLNRDVLHELRWIKAFRNLLFVGGRQRRFRGLRFLLRVMPRRLEAAIQGQLPFSRLFLPAWPSQPA